jgi:hypothetical protein
MDENLQKLWVTVLGGMLIWIIKEISIYLITKDRFVSGIISDINKHISGASRQKLGAKNTMDRFIKWGKYIPFPINYKTGRWAFYTSMQSKLPKYLKNKHLLMVMSIYQLMWEIDVSFEGFANTINSCENKDKKVNQITYDRLQEQLASIVSSIEVLGEKPIRKLEDLEPIEKRINEHLNQL